MRFDHIFRAFSNTKLVTSCAIMLLVEEGKLRPVMDRSFPLAEAAAAHARMEAGDHIGKIVLEIGNG